MPADLPDKDALEKEYERLSSGLRRCRKMLDDYRAKTAANANGDYRPPYNAEDGVADKHGKRGGDAS